MNIGAFGENFPYTNFHDLNLDWIISILKAIKEDNEDIKALIPEIEEILPLISTLETLPATMEEYQNEINATIAELESIINTSLHPLSNIICLTDSYGSDDPDNNRMSWCTHLQTKLGLVTNLNYRKIYTSGGSFGDDDNTKNLYNVFVINTQSIPDAEKALVTNIIIESGINEWNESNTIARTKMTALDTYIRANFPNAKISLFGCGWGKYANVRYATLGKSDATYTTLYREMANTLNWLYLYNISPLIISNHYIDAVHPDSTASKQISDIIYNAIMYGNNILFNAFTLFNVNIQTSSTLRSIGYAYYDGANIIWNPVTVSLDAIPDIPGGFTGEVAVGTIETSLIIGYDVNTYPAPTSIVCKLGYRVGTTWYERDMRANIRFDNTLMKPVLYLRNNGTFTDIPSQAIENIADTYILLPQMVIPVAD